MKVSIWQALFLSFLAVIWGTFLLTTTTTQLTSEKVLQTLAHDIMESVSTYAMEQSQNYLSKAQRATQLTKRLLRSEVLVQGNARALENYFLEQLMIYPDISGIYLGAPNGNFFFVSRTDMYTPGGTRTKVIHTEKGVRKVSYRWRDAGQNLVREEEDPTDPYDPRQRPWYKGALASDSIYWTDPYIFYTSQKPGITISGPTYKTSGALRGIVGVDIEIDQLSTFISQLRIGKNGRAFMLNRNRDVVAFHDVEKIKFTDEAQPAATRLVKIDEFQDPRSRAAFDALGIAREKESPILLNRAEQTLFEFDGQRYEAMFTPFPDPQWPWIIGMYMPQADYLGALKQNRVNNYLLTFAISVIASFLILFIARSIARPVIGLRSYAKNIAHGDYDRGRETFLQNTMFREISETADRFDTLMGELEEAQRERQTTAAILKNKEDQYRSLVENLDVGVFRIGSDGQILSANKALARMVGYASIDALKQHSFDEFYLETEARGQLLDALRAQRFVRNWTLRFKTHDAREPIWVSLTCGLKGGPEDFYIEGVIEDITERKSSEEMLILSERMAAVGTLASGVAHEFNNIHTGVLGFAELGARTEGIPERVRAYFETIRDSSLRARDLTTNLLSCSSRQSVKMVRADLNSTIRDSFALVERAFASDGVELISDFAPIPEFLMDRAQVGQVVLNFLINARHALIGRPHKQICVTSGCDQTEAWVRVSDSGCGIPEEALQKIFTPFFSTKGEHACADSPQATVRGSGLGLSVCHTIAKNHDGEIRVDSQVGVGSHFTLALPLREALTEEGDIRIEYSEFFAAPQTAERILVLDDEPNIRELLAQVLTSQGYEVVTTDDGEEGLRLVREEKVDLVLIDLQMPKMNGTDFLSALQALPRHKRPFTLVVSGKISDAVMESLSGFDIYASLKKPFAIDELQSLVRAAISQRNAEVEV